MIRLKQAKGNDMEEYFNNYIRASIYTIVANSKINKNFKLKDIIGGTGVKPPKQGGVNLI